MSTGSSADTERSKGMLERIPFVPNSRSARESIAGIGFASPFLTLFGLFLLFPLVYGFYISLFNWDPVFIGQSEFVGLSNYTRMFEDPVFWTSLTNSLLWTLMIVPLVVTVPLVLALAVTKDVKGKWFLRTVFFSPSMLTVAVVALIWMQLYEPTYGPISYYLGFIMENPPNWLNSHTYAMPAVVIASLWGGMGVNFVIFIAARQGIPERLYEAARLDGASTWQMFRDITLPQMKHALLFVMITSLIASFQVFEIIFIMTDGGPGQNTQTMVVFLYEAAFGNQNFGYAAAIGYVLFVILFIISVANYYLLEGYTSRVEGEVIEEDTNE